MEYSISLCVEEQQKNVQLPAGNELHIEIKKRKQRMPYQKDPTKTSLEQKF